MYRQMTLEDYDIHQETTKSLPLLEQNILDFLLNNYYGKKKINCSQQILENHFNINDRQVRDILLYLTLNTKYVFGTGSTGFYVCATKEEELHANDWLQSRLETSLERIFANGSHNRNWIYKKLAELEKKYPVLAEGQLDIKGSEHSYIKKEDTHRAK